MSNENNNNSNLVQRQQAAGTNNNVDNTSRGEWSEARRLGVSPSIDLRRHFAALARRVKQWSAPTGRPAKIGVTSLDRVRNRNRNVGKSSIAFNLAASLTRIGGDRILLVESDFGKYFISRKLGYAGATGLSEIIVDGVEPSECILSTPINDLSVLGPGHISELDSVEMPFDLLGPILDSNFDQFGYLIFDLPVANDLTSCYSILPYLDGVMLTVEAGKIDRKQIDRAKQRLANMGVELIGLVINQV